MRRIDSLKEISSNRKAKKDEDANNNSLDKIEEDAFEDEDGFDKIQ